ncbi:MAG TPA: thymidylate kinase [Pseudomonas sp.]|nr:thymidylate kinase [Pseudomonas sp.]
MSRFVVVEGLDGVGKSTLVKELAESFSGHAMSTPGPALRESRQSVLNAFSQDELAKALFYTASVSSEGRRARILAESGAWVFMDRYWASTVAYAKARGVTADLDALSKSLVQPDITVLLVLDESERQRRLNIRGATSEDMETLDAIFRKCVLDELHARANLVVDITGLAELDAASKLSSSIIEYLALNEI